MAGRPPAVCSFQLSAELSFELIVEIFISRCCFRGSLKPLSCADCTYTQNTPPTFPPITSPFLPHDDPSLSFSSWRRIRAREREKERKRFVRYEWNGWLKCFQSSNNREWEEILVSYRKWHSLSSLKSSFRRVSEGAWHQPSVHNRWNRCVAN